MDEQRGSLWPLERLVETWAEGARDEEIERVVDRLKGELRRRGHEFPCERRGDDT